MNGASTGSLSCKSNCKFDVSKCTGRSGAGGSGGTNGSGGRFGGAGGTIFGNGGAFATGGRNNGGRGGTAGRGGAAGTPTPTDAGSGQTACTNNADCGRNRVCCGTMAGGQLTGIGCQQACTRGELTVECGKASDCGRNQVCCGTLNGNQTQYDSLACAATCGGRNEYTVCTTNAECAQGTTCRASTILPSEFKVCR
jgi:hypothetical protein